jgi:hypothetical protein
MSHAAIAPYREARAWARREIDNFVEVAILTQALPGFQRRLPMEGRQVTNLPGWRGGQLL